MQGTIKSVGHLEYVKVTTLNIAINGSEFYVEIPDKVLDKAGWKPSSGENVEYTISKEKPNLDEWDIVYSGYAYLQDDSWLYISFGGLQLRIPPKYAENIKVGDHVYFAIKKL